MYSINTLKIDQCKLQITIEYDGKIIGEKILELSFNEDKTPTFVDSGYAYSSIDFDGFIKSLNTNQSNLSNPSFSFDDQDRFDGFESIKTKKSQQYLSIKTSDERSSTSIWVLLTEESLPGIISDLNYMKKQIDELVKLELEYYSLIENPYPE